ncbi:uncharacterized protein VTP21DRAFT_19 [Calcarisporiella thermophila]|uniref:uncharacterized protein n=1 Tax=Calcarisporiella thermophila TaxID=911321 RepID=UPI003743C763
MAAPTTLIPSPENGQQQQRQLEATTSLNPENPSSNGTTNSSPASPPTNNLSDDRKSLRRSPQGNGYNNHNQQYPGKTFSNRRSPNQQGYYPRHQQGQPGWYDPSQVGNFHPNRTFRSGQQQKPFGKKNYSNGHVINGNGGGTVYYPLPQPYYYMPAPGVQPPSQNGPSIEGADQERTAINDADLRTALRKQLEYYFSRQNLANDVYLVSKMDAQMYVSISIIAEFKLVKALTTDLDLIVEVLRESPNVIVDESGEKVRPNFSNQRNTIILRDIPEDATEEEIRSIFETENAKPIKSIKPDISNIWYVTFETEDDTLQMWFAIRDKSFRGNPIASRIKSENILKSFYSPENTSLPSSDSDQPHPHAMPYGNYYTPGMYPPTVYPNYPPHMHQQYPYSQHNGGYVNGYPARYQQQQDGQTQEFQRTNGHRRRSTAPGNHMRSKKDGKKATNEDRARKSDDERPSHRSASANPSADRTRAKSSPAWRSKTSSSSDDVKYGSNNASKETRHYGEGSGNSYSSRANSTAKVDSGKKEIRAAPNLGGEQFPPLPTANGRLTNQKEEVKTSSPTTTSTPTTTTVANVEGKHTLADLVKSFKPNEVFKAPPRKSPVPTSEGEGVEEAKKEENSKKDAASKESSRKLSQDEKSLHASEHSDANDRTIPVSDHTDKAPASSSEFSYAQALKQPKENKESEAKRASQKHEVDTPAAAAAASTTVAKE